MVTLSSTHSFLNHLEGRNLIGKCLKLNAKSNYLSIHTATSSVAHCMLVLDYVLKQTSEYPSIFATFGEELVIRVQFKHT